MENHFDKHDVKKNRKIWSSQKHNWHVYFSYNYKKVKHFLRFFVRSFAKKMGEKWRGKGRSGD